MNNKQIIYLTTKFDTNVWDAFVEGKILIRCEDLEQIHHFLELLDFLIVDCNAKNYFKGYIEYRKVLGYGVLQYNKIIFSYNKHSGLYIKGISDLATNTTKNNVYNTVKKYKDLFINSEIPENEPEKTCESGKIDSNDKLPIIENEVVTVSKILNKDFFEVGKVVVMNVKYPLYFSKYELCASLMLKLKGLLNQSKDNKIRGIISAVQDKYITLRILWIDKSTTDKVDVPVQFIDNCLNSIEVI